MASVPQPPIFSLHWNRIFLVWFTSVFFNAALSVFFTGARQHSTYKFFVRQIHPDSLLYQLQLQSLRWRQLAFLGDTYRNCLYGMFATAENKDGCHEIKEEKDVGHKFVNTSSVTICICRTNECNGYNNPHHKVPTPPPSAARGFSSSNHFSKPFSADPAPLLRSRSGSLDRKAPVPIIEAISPPSTTAPTDRLGPKSFLPVSGGFSSTRAPTTSGPKSFLSASVSTGATSTLSTAAPSEGPGAKPSAPSALSRGTNIPGSFPFISMTIAFFGINVLLWYWNIWGHFYLGGRFPARYDDHRYLSL